MSGCGRHVPQKKVRVCTVLKERENRQVNDNRREGVGLMPSSAKLGVKPLQRTFLGGWAGPLTHN